MNRPTQATDTALYFPFIRVPRSPWFNQVLLYWDKVASIVPDRPDRETGVDPYMRELNQLGLLDFVRPEETLGEKAFEIEQVFMNHLLTGSPSRPEPLRTYSDVHVDKMTHGVFCRLEEQGLAMRNEDPQKWDWWRIETTTADSYMSYLASTISGARPGTLPVTDRMDTLATLGPHPDDFSTNLARLRYTTIRRALPTPVGPIEPRDLIDFKESNADQLRRCRIYLDEKLADLACVEDPDHRAVKANAVLLEIEDSIDDLSRQMKRRRWPAIGLAGVCAVTSAALATGATLVTGGGALLVGLSVGAGLLGAVPAVQETVGKFKEPRYNDRAPLAYAALAGQHFA